MAGTEAVSSTAIDDGAKRSQLPVASVGPTLCPIPICYRLVIGLSY